MLKPTEKYKRVGIGDKTFFTFASGGSFSKYSHEFQTVCDAGEDFIYLDIEKNIAINEEVYSQEVLLELQLDPQKLEKVRTIEVGNIFKLGTKYSKLLGLSYLGQNGNLHPVVMGSCGIGPTRQMGIIVELFADKKGIVWPEEVSPFQIHLLNITNSEKGEEISKKTYNDLTGKGFEVLLDDREVRAGEKFADANLIGCTYRAILSEQTLALNSVEIKKRNDKQTLIISFQDLSSYLNVPIK